MTVGQTDPLFPQAITQARTALGAATGENPLPGAVVIPGYNGPRRVDRAGRHRGRHRRRQRRPHLRGRPPGRRRRRRSERRRERADDGLRRPGDRRRRPRDRPRRRSRRVGASSSAFDRLAAGPSSSRAASTRSATARTSSRAAWARSRDGNSAGSELPVGRRAQRAARERARPMHDEIAVVRRQLVTRAGPFKPLRDLQQLERQSPGFFQLRLRGGRRARRLARRSTASRASFLRRLRRGGGEVGARAVLPGRADQRPAHRAAWSTT